MISSTATLRALRKEVAKCAILSREEFLEIWFLWRERHDFRLRNILLESNYRFVLDRARSLGSQFNLPAEELFSAGVAGLIWAFEKFDPKKASGGTFLNFAGNWIKVEMDLYITECNTIKLSQNHLYKMNQFYWVKELLLQRGKGKMPTDFEVGEWLGWSKNELSERLSHERLLKSAHFDFVTEDDGLPPSLIATPEEIAFARKNGKLGIDTKRFVKNFLADCKDGEKVVAKEMFFAPFYQKTSLNFAEMGRQMDRTLERARQLHLAVKNKFLEKYPSREALSDSL